MNTSPKPWEKKQARREKWLLAGVVFFAVLGVSACAIAAVYATWRVVTSG